MRDQAARLQAGMLAPTRSRQRVEVGRADPPPGLHGLADYLWWVRWSTPEPHRQAMIPRPAVHVVAERLGGEARIRAVGVPLRRFDRVLEGEGRVVAVAFRPGCFRPLLPGGVGVLRGREVPLAGLLGLDDAPLARHLLGKDDHHDGPDDDATAAAAVAARLCDLPTPDPVTTATALELAGLVERAEVDTAITRAEHLAGLAGVSLRTLQRRFAEYVGATPKWVVQRCRLLDVAAAAHAGDPVDWAALAADLGYTDQSHLIRAFTALVGTPPATYAAQA